MPFIETLIKTIFRAVFLLSTLLFFSCSTAKKLERDLHKQISNAAIFAQAHTGFMLYNPENKQVIFQKDAHKYFTPASNTKVFTFYTSLKILGDSIPALNYEHRNDTLFFWGTGDPTFLNPYLSEVDIAFHFLQKTRKTLVFSNHNFVNKRYGEGWMWDDYPYSFQTEISPFPIYSNLITVKSQPNEKGFEVQPPYFKKFLFADSDLDNQNVRIRRNEFDNKFRYNSEALSNDDFIRARPFKTSPELLVQLLSDTLKKPVYLAAQNFRPSKNQGKLYGHSPIPLYKELMQNSDNHIAEQLLILCANEIFDTLQIAKTIQYSIDSLLQTIPDRPLWVDGSGVSRYNLFTPRSLVWLWEKIQNTLSEAALFPLLATGGVNGTIKKWYAGEQIPYVFGKTGTVRNCHSLSGFIKTKSGKTLIFSFMHNNYKGGSTPFKQEMAKILETIRVNF